MTEASQQVIDLLKSAVDDERWGTGFQLAASLHGELIIDEAYGCDGLGEAVDPDSLFPIYCAGKPILSILLAILVERGEISWEDQLGHVVAGLRSPVLAAATIADLAGHRAGLDGHPSLDYLLRTRDDRIEHLLLIEPTERVGMLGYSETVAWELLALAIEGATGRDFPEVSHDLLLEPMGIDARFVVEPGSDDARRLRVNIDIADGHRMPLLWERAPSNLTDLRPATGAMASMRALNNLYTRLLDSLSGQDQTILSTSSARRLVSPQFPAEYDPILGRRCQFGLGLMVDLRAHRFAESHTTSSFGHSGFSSMTVAGADEPTGVSYALHLNGTTDALVGSADPDTNPLKRRMRIIDLLFDAVGSTR